MYNFDFYVPTKILFGKDRINDFGKEVAVFSNKVLLVYGGGSIKRNGIYDAVIDQLVKNNIEYVELSGIDPNPRIESVREGSRLCKENNINGVIAIGGGSSIDCAKVIAASAVYDGDGWDLVLDKTKIVDSLPVFSVLTLAATGSEMNGGAVISNMSTNEKLGTYGKCMTPKVSVLDPTYTFSVPKKHTAAGVADIMSHTFENYFSNTSGTMIQKSMAEAVLRTCIHYGPIALADPNNYDARSNLMWASSWAINGLLSLGSTNNWTVHPIEHELSAFYDITHGEGLAILTPSWMRYVLSDSTVENFVNYGVNVWNIDSTLDKYEIANKAIDLTEDFFVNKLNIPKNLSELNIDDRNFEIMSKKAVKNTYIDGFVKLDANDVKKIYEMCL